MHSLGLITDLRLINLVLFHIFRYVKLLLLTLLKIKLKTSSSVSAVAYCVYRCMSNCRIKRG